jgi:hypothetical protein
MKFPQAPIREAFSDPLPLSWASYFSALFVYASKLPPSGTALPEYADDTSASLAGLPLYGYYRTGSIIKQRIV